MTIISIGSSALFLMDKMFEKHKEECEKITSVVIDIIPDNFYVTSVREATYPIMWNLAKGKITFRSIEEATEYFNDAIDDINLLRQIIDESSSVLLVTYLGGYLGSAFTPLIYKMCKELSVECSVLASRPLTYYEHTLRKNHFKYANTQLQECKNYYLFEADDCVSEDTKVMPDVFRILAEKMMNFMVDEIKKNTNEISKNGSKCVMDKTRDEQIDEEIKKNGMIINSNSINEQHLNMEEFFNRLLEDYKEKEELIEYMKDFITYKKLDEEFLSFRKNAYDESKILNLPFPKYVL